jgi:protein-histidine pros-kinase
LQQVREEKVVIHANKNTEMLAIKKDNSTLPVEISLSPILIKNNWSTLIIVRDITERRKLEKELEEERKNLERTVSIRTKELKKSVQELESSSLRLEQAHNHIKRYTYALSHGMRTEINNILGFANLVKKESTSSMIDQGKYEYFNEIINSSNQLKAFMDDLIIISKIDTGNLEPNLTYFSIDEVVNKASELFKEKLSENKLSSSVLIEENVTIKSDRTKLLDILSYLLNNSIKFTKENGKVELIVKKETSDKISILVKDTGIGIKEEDINKIFDEFFQSEFVIRNRLGGTGMGLSIAVRLAEILGGNINVESTYGKGSQFTLTLPLNQVD